jgi:hypothetical protein
MIRKYNAEQRVYMLAKAHLDALMDEQAEMERNYIKAQNIINDDGTAPEMIYCIDDEEIFERINREFSELPESKAHWAKILEAEDLVKQAETQLIAYGLSIAPARERDILSKAAERDYTTRKKLIDLVLKLDASTVPAKA